MKQKNWFQIIKNHASLILQEEYMPYAGERIHLRPGKLYFVVEGCVIVRSKHDHHVLYLVRTRGCLNMEALIQEQYDYEYIRIHKARLLVISVDRMHQLLLRYPKLMPRLLRHEHFILDQIVQFSLVYRTGCTEAAMRKLYERLHPPFSYAVFQKYVRNDILCAGVDAHDIERQ